MDITVDDKAKISIKSDKYHCYKCGDIKESETLWIGIEPYDGTYCLKCIARFVFENIPKLEKRLR